MVWRTAAICFVVAMRAGYGAEKEASPPSTPVEILSRAVRAKERRELEEAKRLLDRGETGRRDRRGLRIQAPAQSTLAVDVAIDLERIDLLLRMGEVEGLASKIDAIEGAFVAPSDVARRARALRAVLFLREGHLLEPNAISRVDAGQEFRTRFFAGLAPGEEPNLQPNLAIRQLTDLPVGETKDRKPGGDRQRPLLVACFLTLQELRAGRDAMAPFFDLFPRDPRVLLALYVFTGSSSGVEPLPSPGTGDLRLDRAVVYWMEGAANLLTRAPVRSRFEWIPGPTFLLVGKQGRLLSWRWPHESWQGFVLDVERALGEPK